MHVHPIVHGCVVLMGLHTARQPLPTTPPGSLTPMLYCFPPNISRILHSHWLPLDAFTCRCEHSLVAGFEYSFLHYTDAVAVHHLLQHIEDLFSTRTLEGKDT